jgi:hypothetical protein
MNNPVLLPKRKDYGFLKAPPSLKSIKLVNIDASPGNLPSNLINRNNLPNYMRFRLATTQNANISTPKKDYIAHTTKPLNHLISHKLDNLQIKYELKSPNFSNGLPTSNHPRAVTTINHNKIKTFGINSININTYNNSSTTPPNSSTSNQRPEDLVPLRAATLQSIDFKREHLKRIAYTSESGTNFLNLQRQHSFLSFPIRRLPLKPSIGSLISSNHFDILTTQIRNSSKRDISPQNHHNHQLNSSSSSDEQLIFADDPFSKHVLLNCNTCNISNNYNADCIMCKFKNKFNGYNLSKNGKRRVKKIEKIEIDKIKSSAKSKTKSATVSVESAQPFPHLQKNLLQERIPQFYDKDLLEDTGEMSFINNEISRSADKDELIVLEQNLDDIENDEDVIPKLTLWLV